MVLQPKIMYHLAVIFALALMFYLVIPGIGAFRMRNAWRKFRSLLLRSALLPPVSYADLRRSESIDTENGRSFRFFGRLQALQQDNTVWLTNGTISLPAELQHVHVHILTFSSPLTDEQWKRYPAYTPQRVKWEKISSLPEQTRVFISGKLLSRNGQAVFVDNPDEPLFVLIYEGRDNDLLIRGTWSGREKNEYWNSLTPGALSLGFFSLFIYFYVLVRMPQFYLPAITALTLACAPFSPLLPPGIVSYYFYRRFWQRGRVLRAQRDLLRLPLSFFSEKERKVSSQSVVLHGGEVYEMRKCAVGDIPNSTAAYRISPALPARLTAEYLVFFGKGSDSWERPEDPMAEAIIVPGDPFELSYNCQRYAIRYEVIAILILILGTGLTEFVLFVIFSVLVL